MANIVNSFFADYKPEDIVLNVEKFFDEHPDLDSEHILTKYGNGRKVELYIGYDIDEYDEDAEKEYYIEAWNNDELIATYYLSNYSEEERLSVFYVILDDMTKSILEK